MRKILFFAFFSICILALTSCQGQQKPIETIIKDEGSGFVLITDTVKVDKERFQSIQRNFNIKTDIIRYKNRYVLFYAKGDSLLLTTFDKNLVPQYDSTFLTIEYGFYYTSHLFVQNDSLFLKLVTRDDNYTLLFIDLDSKKDSLIYRNSRLSIKNYYNHVECYEDEHYVVDYLDDGEFGKFVTFFDKGTGENHCFLAPMNRILKLKDDYYILSYSHLFRINTPMEDFPTDTLLHRPSVVYSTIKAIENCSFTEPFEGWYYLDYVDAPSCQVEQENVYVSGFVCRDSLYTIVYRPSKGFFLDKFTGPEGMKDVLKILDSSEKKWRFIYQMCPNMYCDSNYAFIRLFRDENEQSGFIEVSNDSIRTVFIEYE